MFKRLLFFALVISLVGAVPRAANAAIYIDPQPPMSWEEMRKCELVVAAHYESHTTGDAARLDDDGGSTHDKQQTMILHVDRVLKGGDVKAGASLRVELRHWYTIELSPQDFFIGKVKPDGVPRLCYKWQMNPGPLVPRQLVENVREDAVYFFPKEKAPALERREQVQLPPLEKGWHQVIEGHTPEVPFLLVQSVSLQQERAALEELDATRDPATLDLLFDWLATPRKSGSFAYTAQQALMTVGDQGGDVYNRAAQRLSLLPKDWPTYAQMTPSQKSHWVQDEQKQAQELAFSNYARIMAEVDGERAARDFETMIAHGSPALAETAGAWLGFTYSEHALNLSFQLLENLETAPMGAMALRDLLRPTDSSGRSPRARERQTAHLQALAMPRLAAALHSKVFDASRTEAASAEDAPDELKWMRMNRQALEETLAEEQPPAPAPVDIIHARQVLLRPGEKALDMSNLGREGQALQEESRQLIKAIDRAADPRFIPLLVEMMRTVSPQMREGEVQGTIQEYLVLYPFAFEAEMKRQGLSREYPDDSPFRKEGLNTLMQAVVGDPLFVWTLEWPDGSFWGTREISNDVPWIQRYAASPALLHIVAQSIRSDLAGKAMGPATMSLRFLLVADSTAARPLLNQALGMRATRPPHEQAPLLALGVANGHPQLLGELLRLVTVSVEQERTRAKVKPDRTDGGGFSPNNTDPRVLLWAKKPAATNLYLKLLDESLADMKDSDSYFDRIRLLSPSPDVLLQALFSDHPREFFERVSREEASPSLAHRQVAEQVLRNRIGWNLDLDAQALKRERTLKLKTVLPLLVRLGALDETKMRELLLERLGTPLPKAPEQLQSALLRLASNPDPAVAFNALHLLALTLGDDSVQGLAGLAPSQKERAFKAMLRDRANRN